MSRILTHRVRAWRDYVRRSLMARLFDKARPRVERLDRLKRVLFVRWDAKWGDSVVFSFVPRELQRHGVTVEVMATADMAPLFSDQYGVDAVHVVKKRAGYGEIRRLARQIGEFDLVVFFSQLANHRALYLLSQVQARHIASLDDSVGLVDLKLGELTRGQHFADKYLALIECCGISNADMRYIVPRDEQSEARVEAFVQGRRPFVCFNAYSKGRARSFNRETSQRLIKLLQQMLPGHTVCVLSAPGKQKEVEALCERLGERVFSLPDTRTIYDNIALIARAEALISGNTATVHMADGLDVPTFEIFPHDRVSYEDWHSRHPRSISLLAEPSDPLDVNQLDWQQLEAELGAFAEDIRVVSGGGMVKKISE